MGTGRLTEGSETKPLFEMEALLIELFHFAGLIKRGGQSLEVRGIVGILCVLGERQGSVYSCRSWGDVLSLELFEKFK